MLTLRNALVLSCVCLSGLPARAQDASIIVTEQKIQKLNEKEFLIVTLKNMSQKSIIGFIVRLNLIDGKGLPFDSVVMGGVSYDPNIDRKKPGESWTLMVDPTSDKEPTKVAVRVSPEIDHVLFADLSGAGPDSASRSNLLRAEYSGARGERQRLKSVLKSRGVQGLVDALSQEEWARGRAN